MKINRWAFLLIVAILAMGGCKKDKSDLPVAYKFVLIDTLGNVKTQFNQGENIIFSFRIINNGSEDLFVENFFPNDDFFRIYQTNALGGTVDLGIPYLAYTMPYGYFVYKTDGFKIEYPWNNITADNANNFVLFGDNERPDLPKGTFYTEFSQLFTYNFEDEDKTDSQHFKINFTVK